MRKGLLVGMMSAGVLMACNDDEICLGESNPAVRVSVRDAAGTDLVGGTTVTAVRILPTRVDSLDMSYSGAGMEVLLTDLPGQYRLRATRVGYQPSEQTVAVVAGGECNEIVEQNITFTLTPVSPASH